MSSKCLLRKTGRDELIWVRITDQWHWVSGSHTSIAWFIAFVLEYLWQFGLSFIQYIAFIRLVQNAFTMNNDLLGHSSLRGGAVEIIITLACRPSVLNPSFSVFFRSREIEFALGHRRLRVQRAPVTYSVQFQNGGFSLSDLTIFHTVWLNFQRIVPVSQEICPPKHLAPLGHIS